MRSNELRRNSSEGILMAAQNKELRFINKQSLKEFKALPDEIQKRFALDLQAVMEGKRPFSNFKNISDSVGVGTIELIENGRPAYRTLYVAKYENAVYVLHSFTKTTNGVDRQAMETAKQRYKAMIFEIKK